MPQPEFARYETITPAMAAAMLAGNKGNRPLRATTASDYAAQMKRGEWGSTAQPIILDDEAEIIDGQHRLSAVVESGIAQCFLVVRGADRGQFRYIDRHARRKGSDVLSIAGESNVIALASCLSWCEKYERRGIRVDVSGPSGDRILKLAGRWPHAGDSVKKFQAARGKHRWMQTQAISAAHAIATRYLGGEFADRFLDDLTSGVGMPENDAVWRLRELLVNNFAASSRITNDAVFCTILKAICLRAAGRSVRNLAFRPKSDSFPVLPGDPS